MNNPNENDPCLDVESNRGTKAVLQEKNFKMNLFNKIRECITENMILFLTILGIFGGVAVGFIGRIYKPNSITLLLISFPGEMLLRILKMLILPLIISSLITGLAQLDPKSSGKMGSRAMGFYVLTTFIATITGIIMALIVRPGRQQVIKNDKKKLISEPISTLDALLDIVRNMFPENIVQACTQQITTVYKKKMIEKPKLTNNSNLVNGTIIHELAEQVTKELIYLNSTNVMGLVVFCIIFGIFISHSKSEAQILYDFFYVMNELIMKIVALIMWYSPFGILCLVAGNIIKIENMSDTAKRLSIYMFTVILGLIVHALFTIQMIYFLTTRKNPFKFLKGMLQAWLTAIGTASSSATLPITFKCLEENNKVDKRVTRFMLPLGATINMDGTALYQCVATIFIAQLNGITLSIGQLVAISLASTATSIGVASVPSAALVTMLIVLGTVGLPTEDISYIVTVDWLLDRLRTSINVLGDAYGCGIVEHLSKKELKKLDEEAEFEFAQIITKNDNVNPNVEIIDISSNQGQSVPEELLPTNSFSILNERKLSIQKVPISHSISQQFNEFKIFERRLSNRSECSVNQKQLQKGIHTETPSPTQPPSVVVIDAVRRRSRALLFSSKIPANVYSMPQISQYCSKNNNLRLNFYNKIDQNKNNNNKEFDEDSKV